jgi:hypothetical protein
MSHIPGFRQDEKFIFFSVEHLAILMDKGGLKSDKVRMFEVTRDFKHIEEAYKKLQPEERPLICELAPLLPEADNFKGTEEANLIRSLFAMHVRGFPEHKQLQVTKPINKGDNWVDEETIRALSFDWMREAVRVLEERSDGKGGQFPLCHGLQGTSQDTSASLTKLNIRNALTAKTETAKS